jgi:hypothetical protein
MIVPQNGELQPGQLGSGIEPEFVGQPDPVGVERRQRGRGPPALLSGRHPEPEVVLLERVALAQVNRHR